MVYNNNMMKKIVMVMVLCLSLFYAGFSAPVNITQCPVTTQNDTEYYLSDTFSFSSSPCFDLTDTQNVVIDGRNVDFFGSSDFDIRSYGNSNNAIIQNVKHDSFQVDVQGENNDLTLQDSYLTGKQFVYTGIGSGIPNTNGASAIFKINSGGTLGVQNNELNVLRNRFESSVIAQGQGDNNNLIHVVNNVYGYVTTIEDNDFIGYGVAGRRLANNGATGGININFYPTLFSFQNNVLVDNIDVDTYIIVDNNFACSNYQIGNTNLLPSEGGVDSDGDGLADTAITISNNGCTLLNDVYRTTKALNNGQFNKSGIQEYATLTPLSFGSQLFSNTRYYLGESLTLTSTDVWNFNTVQNSVLDVSKFASGVAITTDNTNTIRMGTNNKIEGLPDESDFNVKPEILVNEPSLNIAYSTTSPDTTNWAIVTYNSKLTVEGIDFNLNQGTNYGAIKTNQNNNGDNLVITDSRFIQGFQLLNNLTPMIQGGGRIEAMRNEFVINGNSQFTISNSISNLNSNIGGHKIQDNTFIGSGETFDVLLPSLIISNITQLVSNINHNEFLDGSGGSVSIPLDLDGGGLLFWKNPALYDFDGGYKYVTGCDSYNFDVGNYYETIPNGEVCNDVNLDGFCDDSLLLQNTSQGEIFDNKALVSYPYDFAGNTGSVIPVDICGNFVFNINSPLDGQTYNSSIINFNWEYQSTSYNPMVCTEYFADENKLYDSVANGEDIDVNREFTNGQVFYYITCENEDVSFTSQTVEFCVNNCNGLASFVQETTPPEILGCTNPSATNYNPSATQDDGSCILDNGDGDGDGDGGVNVSPFEISGIFSNDIDESSDNVNALFTLIETPLGYIILIAFLFIAFSIVGFIFAFAGRFLR